MKFDKEKMRLYAITDRHWLNGRSLKEVVKESLDGGVTFLQLRDKNSDDETFLQEAAELQELCRDYKVPLIINDNVEIALKMNADGVHVGQSDMEAGAVREKLGPDKILGVSARTVEQALLAQERGADYLGVGAVFANEQSASITSSNEFIYFELFSSIPFKQSAISSHIFLYISFEKDISFSIG